MSALSHLKKRIDTKIVGENRALAVRPITTEGASSLIVVFLKVRVHQWCAALLMGACFLTSNCVTTGSPTKEAIVGEIDSRNMTPMEACEYLKTIKTFPDDTDRLWTYCDKANQISSSQDRPSPSGLATDDIEMLARLARNLNQTREQANGAASRYEERLPSVMELDALKRISEELKGSFGVMGPARKEIVSSFEQRNLEAKTRARMRELEAVEQQRLRDEAREKNEERQRAEKERQEAREREQSAISQKEEAFEAMLLRKHAAIKIDIDRLARFISNPYPYRGKNILLRHLSYVKNIAPRSAVFRVFPFQALIEIDSSRDFSIFNGSVACVGRMMGTTTIEEGDAKRDIPNVRELSCMPEK